METYSHKKCLIESSHQAEREKESSDSEEELPLAITGGYENDRFVKTLKEIEDEDLLCPICTLVSRDAQQSECCGKVFCRVCMNRLEQSSANQSCPTCRSTGFKCFTDKRSNRSILNMKVNCTRQKRGCKWQGTLQQDEKHSTECDYRTVGCPECCGKRVHQRKINRHLREFCPKRLSTCILCGESGEWVYITGVHDNKCPEKIIECKHKGCGKKIKRRELTQHDSICPKKVLSCSFKDLGCTESCTRESMDQHNHQSVFQHLDKAASIARCSEDAAPKMDHLLQVAPVTLRIHVLRVQGKVRSQPFLAFAGGYKMCLVIKNFYYDVSICLMPGKYDNALRWPFTGRITITLLNQTQDENHYKLTKDITRYMNYRPPQNAEYGPEIKILGLDFWRESTDKKLMNYLVDDTMYFTVTYEKLRNKT